MERFVSHWQRGIRDRLVEREVVDRNRIYTELWAGAGHRPDEVREALRELERVFGVHPGLLRAGDPLTLLFDRVEAGWNPMRRLAFRGFEHAAANELWSACRDRMGDSRTLDAWEHHELQTIGDWVAAWTGKLPDGRIPPDRPSRDRLRARVSGDARRIR